MSRNIILAASLATVLGLAPAAMAQAPGETQGAREGGAQVDALRGAALALRQSLSTLSQEAPGQFRDKAVEQATEALHATNNAIAVLAAAEKDEEKKAEERQKQSSSPEQPANGSAAPARGDAEQAVPRGEGAYALLVVPAGDTLDANVADGCWARVYSDTNFRGEALTFVGNVEVPGVDSALGQGAGYESLIVGPGAALIAGTGQQTITIHPNQRIPDLGSTQPDNMFGTVRSVRLACMG